MKTMVRVVCLSLSVFIILCSFCSFSAAANSTGVSITIHGGKLAVVSDQYCISVNFTNMQSVKDGTFTLKYNPDVLCLDGLGVHTANANSWSYASLVSDGVLNVGCGFAFDDVSSEYITIVFNVLSEGPLEISYEDGRFTCFDDTEAEENYKLNIEADKSYTLEELPSAMIAGEIPLTGNDIVYLDQVETVTNYENSNGTYIFADVFDVDGNRLSQRDCISTGAYAMQYFLLKSNEQEFNDFLNIKFFAVKNDINSDGKADIGDARDALRDSVGLENLSFVQRCAANETGERLTVSDARELLRSAVGLE